MADCSHVIVHCIDFRTQRVAEHLRTSLGVSKRDCDRIAVAGGAANFESVRSNLELSHKLHHTHTAILTVHEDCGAGAKEEDLVKAAEIAHAIGLKPRTFVLMLNGSWKKVRV